MRDLISIEPRIIDLGQTGGTARPSLALEYLQEIGELSESDRSEAEKTLAGALGSIYIGS
jgi:hypothetical protein